jgi:uncharacterized Fe-S cluster-containing protein
MSFQYFQDIFPDLRGLGWASNSPLWVRQIYKIKIKSQRYALIPEISGLYLTENRETEYESRRNEDRQERDELNAALKDPKSKYEEMVREMQEKWSVVDGLLQKTNLLFTKWVENFRVHIVLHGTPDEIVCRAFLLTLKEIVRDWFRRLPQGQ